MSETMFSGNRLVQLIEDGVLEVHSVASLSDGEICALSTGVREELLESCDSLATSVQQFLRYVLSHPACSPRLLASALDRFRAGFLSPDAAGALFRNPALSGDVLQDALEWADRTREIPASGRSPGAAGNLAVQVQLCVLGNPALPARVLAAWSDPQFLFSRVVAYTRAMWPSLSRLRLPPAADFPALFQFVVDRIPQNRYQRSWSPWALRCFGKLLSAVAGNPSVCGPQLAEVFQCAQLIPAAVWVDYDLRLSLAANPRCPSDLLFELFKMNDWHIMQAVLSNPGLERKHAVAMVERLASGEVATSLRIMAAGMLAMCPLLEQADLFPLLFSEDSRVREPALRAALRRFGEVPGGVFRAAVP